MAKSKRLAQAEWEIMDCIWQFEEAVPIRSVVDRLYPNGEKAYTTVQTVMNILVEKGFLRRRKLGALNLYSSLVSRREVVKAETESLVSRVFKGSFGTLATYLVDSADLSDEEIEEIKKLIAAREQQPGKGGS